MSGAIRKSAAPAVGRLQRYLEKLPKFESPEDASPQDLIASYSSYLAAAQLKLAEISKAVESLDQYNDKWIDLLKELQGSAREEEERQYDRMASDEFGLIKVLDRGKEAISRLQYGIDSVKESLSRLTLVDQKATPQSAQPSSAANPSIKLPKIDLPTFSGDITQWAAFWSIFQQSVHSTNLSDANKLAYLLSSLKGDAFKLVAGFTATNQNYPIVIDRLKERFGDNLRIKRDLRTRLKELPQDQKEADLLPVLQEIETVLQMLDSIGAPIEEEYLEDLIESKLPDGFLDEIYKERKKIPNWTVQNLREMMKAKIERQVQIQYIKGKAQQERNREQRTLPETSKTRKTKTRGEDIYNAPSTIMSIQTKPTSAKTRATKLKNPCVFCGERHFNDACKKYASYEERRDRANELQLCRKCLRKGHHTNQCRAKRRPCFHCNNYEHSSALCSVKRTKTTNVSSKEGSTKVKTQTVETTNLVVDEENSEISMSTATNYNSSILMCKVVDVLNPDDPRNREKVAVLFDTGSQRSFIDEDLARRLKLRFHDASLIKVSSFKIRTPISFESSQTTVAFEVNSRLEIIRISTVKDMAKTFPQLEIGQIKQIDEISDPKERIFGKPRIILGIDTFFKFFQGYEELKGGLCIVHTTLGPLIAGKEDPEINDCAYRLNTFNIVDLQQFWDLETIGITDAESDLDDNSAYEQFKAMVMQDDTGRYVVGWPWRNMKAKLSPTFGLCMGRLRSLMNRLHNHKDLLREYDTVFKGQIEQGIIEEAPLQSNGLIHYLPHQMVLTPGKTTKLRIVFDASAKSSQGSSLNEMLHRGPLLLPNLVGILLRSRIYPNLLVADVEKAFLQVGLRQEDRDVTRFLWVKDINESPEGKNLVIYRFTRVLFGITSSPFLLGAVIYYHLEQNNSKTAKAILQNLYVDNVLLGFSIPQEATVFYKESKALFKSAKMNLRHYATNDQTALNNIPEEDRYQKKQTSLLGLQWDIYRDKLGIVLHELPTFPLTKRKISQFIGRHYDPLGLVTPILVPWKVLIQKLWKTNCDWDTPIQNTTVDLTFVEKTIKMWRPWEISIPRKATLSSQIDQLHVFVDASTNAYGAAVYAISTRDANIESHLIFGKTRLLPVKSKLTIPKAELMAAWIGAKAISFIRKHLNVYETPCYAWSDSKCVIEWIRGPKGKLPVFIRNKVETIREVSLHFNYIPSKDNPAYFVHRKFKENVNKHRIKPELQLLTNSTADDQLNNSEDKEPNSEERESTRHRHPSVTVSIPPLWPRVDGPIYPGLKTTKLSLVLARECRKPSKIRQKNEA